LRVLNTRGITCAGHLLRVLNTRLAYYITGQGFAVEAAGQRFSYLDELDAGTLSWLEAELKGEPRLRVKVHVNLGWGELSVAHTWDVQSGSRSGGTPFRCILMGLSCLLKSLTWLRKHVCCSAYMHCSAYVHYTHLYILSLLYALYTHCSAYMHRLR
jgi:hypothetical protein